MTNRLQKWTVVVALAGLGACTDDAPVGPAVVPSILSVSGVQGNGLTARVTLAVSGLDSVRIVYEGPGDGTRFTPATRVVGDSMTRLVVGMRANVRYVVRPQGWRGGAVVDGDTASFLADSLPVPLRAVQLQVTGTPSSGLTLVPVVNGAAVYLVVFDSTGTVRWYVDTSPYFPGRAFDVKQLPNGHLLVFLGATRGWDPLFGRFYEFGLDGGLVRTYAAPPPLYTDNHDILLEFADTVPMSVTLLTYDIRTTDVRPYGGADNVALAGHQILQQRLDGTTEFFWNAWDRFSLLDWIDEPQVQKQGPTADFDHPNSIVRDADGNYVVSWRSLGAITKIDRRTGAILWQLGGRNNQFTFVGDAFGLFSGQHSVKALPGGRYLVYDNGLRHAPPETRVAEYQLDLAAHTATLVWEYRRTPAIFTQFVGWVERLASGNTFIGWGEAGIMQEVTPGKQTVWEANLRINGAQGSFYRAVRLADLYTVRAP